MLEEVPDRANLLARESFYINKFNAVKSNEYYNLSDATLNYNYDRDAIVNIYKETVKEFAQNQCNVSKRDNRAKKLGFKNYGELAFHIYNENLKGSSFAEISRSLGEERSFTRIFINKWDMEKATSQLALNIDPDIIRSYISNGASLKKAAELVGVEEPVAKILVGDFTTGSKNFSVARQMGLTGDELGEMITKDIVDNDLDFIACSRKHGITVQNVQRYFLRHVRKRLKSSDL